MARSKRKNEKRRAKYIAAHADVDTATGPYSKIAQSKWLARYSDGLRELFWRRPDGAIVGCGPCLTDAELGKSQLRKAVLANRPPCDPNASAEVKSAYDRGYFVVPKVVGESEATE